MEYETVIIGAGQAGLSTGYHLTRRGSSCLILEADDRVGDIWRRRYDSLRLYTPRRYSGLPGMPFPGDPWSYPTGREMADYLELYAERLPVRTGTRVRRLTADGDGYRVEAGGETITARHVVVATGGFETPMVPQFAAELDPGIRQLHSSEYHNRGQLPPGPVLVVGASHSGADIAHEVAGEHETVLCGPIRGQLPFHLEGRASRMVMPVLWFAANHVLNERNPLGRKARAEVRAHGGPLLRVRRPDLAEAGVEYVADRVVGVRDGKPELTGGRVLDVASVIWCTGFRKDLGWIGIDVAGADGWPAQHRGAVPGHAGLYFVGLPFEYAFASMLIGGVGRDAAEVARQISADGVVATAA